MAKSPFVITFSGDPLAGKSSLIKAFKEKCQEDGFYIGEKESGKCIIGLEAGQMFRQIANHAGMNLSDFGDFAKSSGNTLRQVKDLPTSDGFFNSLPEETLNKSIDEFVDEYTLTHIEMLKSKYAGKPDVIIVVDSRIAGILMKNLGRENMAVRLAVQHEIAAERLVKAAMDENRKGELAVSHLSADEAYNAALASTIQRTSVERERFISQYSKDPFSQEENAKVDIRNLNNYDLVINTSGTTIDRELEVLWACFNKARENKTYDKFWRSTKYIYPGSIVESEIKPQSSPKVQAIKVDGQYYALSGQEYVGIANHNGYDTEKKTGNESGYPLLPVDVIAKNKQFIFNTNEQGYTRGIQADLYVKYNITQELLDNFTKKYDFKYPERGVAKLMTTAQVIQSKRKSQNISKDIER